MHPNAFLNTFWRMEMRPEVFVAMSFDPSYDGRFNDVIVPAIKRIGQNGIQLSAKRVDISQSGDSILTEIVDGIANSTMVVADISTIHTEGTQNYRNANVLYEVGMALACRQPSEVILIRDDNHKTLFDVSVIPQIQLNFEDTKSASFRLSHEIVKRLESRTIAEDARVQKATAQLAASEIRVLQSVNPRTENEIFGIDHGALINWQAFGVARLLDKGVIRVACSFDGDASVGYQFTQLGWKLRNKILAELPRRKPERIEQIPAPERGQEP